MLERSFAEVLSQVLNTLRRRTLAHPWAVVRRNPLNSAVDTKEVNVRPALGDRLLPCQVLEDERSSPGHTRTLARGGTFAQHWSIVHPRGELPHVTYLGHFHLLLPSLSPTPPTLHHAAHSSHLTTTINHHKAPTKSSRNHHKPPQNTPHCHHQPLHPFPAPPQSPQNPTLAHILPNLPNPNLYTHWPIFFFFFFLIFGNYTPLI
jgi:hypothetical protein